MVPLHRLFTLFVVYMLVFFHIIHTYTYIYYIFTCHCVSATLRLFRIDANRVAIANDDSLTAVHKLWSRFPNTRDEHSRKQTQQQSHMVADSGQ